MSSPGKRKRNSNVEVQETATSVKELIGIFGLGNQTKRLKVEEEASYERSINDERTWQLMHF